MKGLLKNNLYGLIENIKIVFAFIALLGIVLLFTGEANLLNIFSLIVAPVVAVLTISCLRKESSSKWSKYKLTLPVKRKEIVKSQYISHSLISLAGMLTVTLFILLTVLIHGNQYFYYGFRDAVTLILLGGILSILIGAIAYPLYYLWGAERTEVILVLSVLLSLAVIIGLSIFVNFFTGSRDVSDTVYYISLSAIMAITVLMFLLSYFLTCQIFKHKEY